jgi:hypothetical protein
MLTSTLAAGAERFDLELRELRAILRWVAELPPDQREALFEAVRPREGSTAPQAAAVPSTSS